MLGSQTLSVSWLNLRTLPQRLGSSAVAVVGIAGVVTIFVTVLSIGEGFRATMTGAGSPDTAVVLRSGANSEMVSVLSRDDVRIVADAPGVLRSEAGPLASAEAFVIVDLPKRTTGTAANVPLRGVEPAAFEVRPEVRIVEGRRFAPGRMEIIAGRSASLAFAGLEVGNVLELGDNRWTIVGIFEADGTVSESELWCDVRVLQPAYRRGSTYQSVYARLTSAAAFRQLKDALTTDPRLNVSIERESDYYAEQSQVLSAIVGVLGSVIALIMGAAAVFGALNTMYTAVSSRAREIATLRALGFRNGPVVLSVLAESMLLGLVGGVVGGAVAYLGFNGFQTATINWQSFSQVAFAFTVTPRLLAQGIVYALAIGLLGGLLPAYRAARLPVATALREL